MFVVLGESKNIKSPLPVVKIKLLFGLLKTTVAPLFAGCAKFVADPPNTLTKLASQEALVFTLFPHAKVENINILLEVD